MENTSEEPMSAELTHLINLLEVSEKGVEFVKFWRQELVCWRCVLMLLRLSSKSIDLCVYRFKDNHRRLDEHF